MGGYRRPAKVYKLVFADEEMAGLEVRARSVPLGGFLDLLKLAKARGGKLDPAQVDNIGKLFEAFSKALVSWNLEDDEGVPVPATLDGLHSQDIDFVFSIILAWMDAIAGVPAPLERTSPGGVPSEEALIPMAAL